MVSYFILVLQFLSLSFWIGGSAVLLLIVVPIAAAAVPAPVDLLITTGSVFKKFYSLFILNAILLGLTLYVQIAFLSHGVLFKLRIALMLVSVAMVVAAYYRFALTPAMERMETSSRTVQAGKEDTEGMQRKRLQRRSAVLFFVNLLLGIAVVITLLLPLH